ncbi:NAD(P)H-hydrate dehydratase [Sphingomonas sp. ID0503]|uniref:NAD(P)H-hydrate dehydratase n=1 Tax=Sphingomonas sp. ID0503 TaxID=3399691 RepID=UPI003AFA939F
MAARPVLTAAEMRAAEDAAIARGETVESLMERAGRAVADAVAGRANGRAVLILCGPGNNGGDGYVAARYLAQRRIPVRVASLAEPSSDAARAARRAWIGPVEQLEDVAPAPILVDALFGTGLRRPLEPSTSEQIERLSTAADLRLAVDLPSGVATDHGTILSDVPPFDVTVALGALKPAHLLLPSALLCGQIETADLGLTFENVRTTLIERPRLTAPSPLDHKYTRGKVAVIAGVMGGAAMLAATAAQRAGAGYVELIGGGEQGGPHALVRRTWSADVLDDGRTGCVVIGPGLGHDASARDKLTAALASGKALVLDADAFMLLPSDTRLTDKAILTPHAGEFARLFGDMPGSAIDQARAAAAASGAVVLLKGAASVVAHPDGRAAVAPLAPSWLASAGTGDVLAGIIGALIAGGRDPFEAAQAALWLHAEAARRAGPFLIADDLVIHLPAAATACL